MNISVIIPNYNGEHLLKKNFPKVLEAIEYYKKNKKDNVEIIIVDDASTDSSKSVISNFPAERDLASLDKFQKIEIKFIKNKKNLGFSSTINKGVKEAIGEVVVLLNTDVSPEKDFLLPLMDHFKDPEIFAVGCMDKSLEDSKVIFRGRGLGSWQRGFFIHRRGEVDRTNTVWVNGGSGAFRKSIWDKLGGFNELYSPFYWEDIDISYRALKSGYRVLFEPKSKVLHEHMAGAIKSKYSDYKIKTIAYKNQFIFVWENATDLNLQFLHLFWLPYHFIMRFKALDFAFFAGFFSALILLPKIIKSSFRGQKLFIKKDSDVINENAF